MSENLNVPKSLEVPVKELSKNDQLGKITGSQGVEFPVVEINGHKFVANELQFLSLSSSGWLPECSFTVYPTSGVFQNKHYPRDGDVFSIWIRSENTMFKPIRNDFLITDISSSFSEDLSGSQVSITIS